MDAKFMGTRAAVKRFEDVEARRLLLRIMDSPDKFMDHIRMFASILYISFYVPRFTLPSSFQVFPAPSS